MCPELKILSVIFTRPAISRNPGLGSNIPSFTIFIVLYRFKFTTPRLEAYRIACVVMKSLPLLRGSLRCNLRAGSQPGFDAAVMRGSMRASCAGRCCSDVCMDEAVMSGLVPPNPQELLMVRLKSQLLLGLQVLRSVIVPQLLRRFPQRLREPIFLRYRSVRASELAWAASDHRLQSLRG